MTEATDEKLLTAEEFYGLPDDDMRHELVAGRVLSEPPAGFEHGCLGGRLHAVLASYVHARGLGYVCTSDTGFILARSPDTVRAPDVSFVSKERVEPGKRITAFFPGAPDLAVEVASPGDRPGEVRAKVAEYLAAGSRAVWVVDPEARTVTVYRSLFAPRVLGSGETLDGEDILAGFSVEIGAVFAP